MASCYLSDFVSRLVTSPRPCLLLLPVWFPQRLHDLVSLCFAPLIFLRLTFSFVSLNKALRTAFTSLISYRSGDGYFKLGHDLPHDLANEFSPD